MGTKRGLKDKMEKNNKKHLYWVVGLVLITIILSGTLIWINHNSWTIRFEMDDNTKEAVESIKWDEINPDLTKCQEWEKDIEYYCDDIHGDGLDFGDCILNKCFEDKKE